MATTSKYISQRVHGDGIANCSDYPKITAKFTITFSRNPGSDLVTWSTSGMGNWGHNTSGKYGYKFHAYINVNGSGYKSIISKENTTADNWWKATTVSNPSGSFRTTGATATVKIYVKNKHTCKHSDKYCFNGSGTYYKVATYTVPLPTYGVTITYDGNGDNVIGVPETQIVTTFPSNISSQVPEYPLTVSYYNNGTSSPSYIDGSLHREFLHWLSNPGGAEYQPGDPYNTQANCTMIAQWGTAPLNLIAIPDKWITLTFNPMGGEVTPTSKPIYYGELGYSTTPDGDPEYLPGTTYNITTDLDLYPRYSLPIVQAADLVTPVWAGHSFDGWYFDEELTRPVTTPFTVSEDITIFAKWIPLPVHTFTPNGEWESNQQYVWKFVNGQWQKIAPVYKFTNNTWINISE